MPYKSEKIKLTPEQDRRVKLTAEQKDKIRKLYAAGNIGQRPLAKMFGVSRSLIGIIVSPQRAEAVKQRGKEHWRDYQQSKERRAINQKKLRKYKQELYLKGELKEEKNSGQNCPLEKRNNYGRNN